MCSLKAMPVAARKKCHGATQGPLGLVKCEGHMVCNEVPGLASEGMEVEEWGEGGASQREGKGGRIHIAMNVVPIPYH